MIETPSLTGFPAIIGSRPRCLVLGSMPSVKSLYSQQYYAHPRNAFWPIMADIYQFDLALDYLERCQQLQQNGIAVWDVLQACQRQGSLDSAIQTDSIVYNDILGLLQRFPTIQYIVFNGGKAATLFKRMPEYSDFAHVTKTQLPSTSPAHASLSFSNKLAIWKQAFSVFSV